MHHHTVAIGAVLSHKMPDGSEKPVGFVSRTLTDAEKKCSQIKKDRLSCVYGVMCFHLHHFKLQANHKPLLTLFNGSKVVPPQASGRIQRWALTLALYEYTIVCQITTQYVNADTMSRLPLPDTLVQTPTFRRASADGWKNGGCSYLSSTDSNVDTTRPLAVKSALLHQGRMARQCK